MPGIARNKLSIPKVNQNPRPPRLANRIVARNQPAKALGGGKPKGLGTTYTAGGPGMIVRPSAAPAATSTAQASNAAPAVPGSTSSAAVVPAATPPPSSERFAIPTWNPTTAGEQDPRDASYWANLAKLRFNDEQEYRQNEEGEAKENSDYNYALQQAIQNRHVQERQLGEGAIRGNLSASGWLNRTQAEQEGAYTSDRSHALFSHEHELHAFNAAKKALEEGFGIDAATQLAEAVGRRSEREELRALKGEGETEDSGGSGSGASAATGGYTSNPGAQKASAFTKVGLSNNKPVSNGQNAKAFADALKKGKKK